MAVLEALQTTDPKKSIGEDKLDPLSFSDPLIVQQISHIFNLSISSDVIL